MNDLEERFSGALHNASRAWRQALDRRLKYLGVSQASWMTIAVAAKARAPLSQSELADRLGVEGATMVAPSTPRRSASSDCDSGARALAATAMVIQLAWLTPKYLSLRSQAWRQAQIG